MIKTKKLVFTENIKYPDVEIPKEKVTFIVGRSGCGKSSFFKLLNRSFKEKSGDIFYNNINIKEINPYTLRKEILLIGQEPYLFSGSIKENFKKYYNYAEKESISEEKMNFFLNLCSIEISLDKDVTVLSGGQKQRIFLAILISFLPKVLLLDEPSSSLDENNSISLFKNIIEFCKSEKITPIFISHSKNIIETFAENIINLEGENQCY